MQIRRLRRRKESRKARVVSRGDKRRLAVTSSDDVDSCVYRTTMHKPRRKLLRQLEVVLRISRVAEYLRYIAQELPNIARYVRGIACARDSSYSRLTIDPERGVDNRFRLRTRRPGLSCRRIGAPHAHLSSGKI